jgi:superfamily II DNA/RNA helicase
VNVPTPTHRGSLSWARNSTGSESVVTITQSRASANACSAPAGRKAGAILRTALAQAGHLEIAQHSRYAELTHAPAMSPGTIPACSAVVAFSRRAVLALHRELIDHGRSATVLYGAMPPGACREQIQRLVTGEVEVIVTTDVKLSCEEYARFHEPNGYERNVRPYAEALTAICDRDDDGFVQHADLMRGLGAVGFPVANIEGLSRALDPQGTGQVSRSEWRTAIEEFFLAGGSHAVGDTLV